jgi:hypothetical protein
MSTLAACATLVMAMAATERAALIVQAPDSPVRLDRAMILTSTDGPPVLLYGATNLTADEQDQFTVIVFVFDEKGTLKARQVAPARRTLDARGTKHSAMVLDGSPIAPTDLIVVGVNQSQRTPDDDWWRADLQAAAEAAVKKMVPAK